MLGKLNHSQHTVKADLLVYLETTPVKLVNLLPFGDTTSSHNVPRRTILLSCGPTLSLLATMSYSPTWVTSVTE
jgi:hypothetical protein